MALVVADRVKESTTTTGTGTVNLAGAETGFQTFVAGIGNSNTTYYAIVDGNTGDFEVGIGTVTDASPDTLSRDTILQSSNSDSAVNFGSGTKSVFCTQPADKAVFKNADGNIDFTGNLNFDDSTGTDNNRIKMGTGNDLQILHNGTNAKINNASGALQITNTQDDTDVTISTDDGSGGTANYFRADGSNGEAVLYHYGTEKFATKSTGVDVVGNITVSGTVDGRDLATDGTKLDGIEASATADQTAAEIRTLVDSATDSNVFTDADHTKLDGIEASADVTDATNVTAAGALMDSEVTNLAQVKAFDSSDYATAAQGTTADNALPKAGGTMTGSLTISGSNNRINLPNDHFINFRFEMDNADNNGVAYVLLCRNAPNNDVNGRITMDRTSGLRHACQVDIIVSSGSSANPIGSLKAHGVTANGGSAPNGPSYELVTVTYDSDSNSYVALKITNPDNYYETHGAFFTGRAVNSGSNFLVVTPASGISNEAQLTDANAKHTFQGDLDLLDNIVIAGTVDGRDIAADGTKLDGIEASADVTDSTNVSAAGALMKTGGTMTGALDFGSVTGRVITITGDSGLDGSDASIYLGNSPSNYGFDITYEGSGGGNTNAFVVTSTNAGTPKEVIRANQDGIARFPNGTVVTGNITVSGTVDGRDVATDGTKLDGIASSATANPNAIDNVVEDTTPQLGGNLDLNSNDITGTGDINITGTLQTSSNAIIGGNLTVSGTTTTVNTETINLADNNIVLNSNLSSSTAPSENGGITINRGSATDKVFQWNESTDYWEVDDVLEIDTASGYVQIGSKNTGYTHFYTDRPRYYFDKRLIVDEGIVGSYNEDLNLNRTNNGALSSTERIRITSGTTHSDQAFDVTGNITVSGTVDGRDVAADGTKLDGIDTGAEVNQNAFSIVAVSGQTTVAADGKTDTLTLAAGSNVTLTTDASTDTVTISATDTNTDTNTTYGISSETATGGANLRLTGSDSSTDNVKIAGGTNVTVTRTDADTITISSTDTNTEYSNATTSAAGLMSSTDKSKLDGIESGATADQTKSDIDALGINADQVDGIEAASFLRSDAADTATGALTFGNSLTLNGSQTGNYPSLNLQSGSSSTSFINFGTSTDGDEGQIKYTPSTNTIAFTAGTVNTLNITDTAIQANKDITFGDDVAASFGAGGDLTITHESSGSHSVIRESGTGSLYIDATNLFLRSRTFEDMAKLYTNGGVELYYDNGKKFETTSGGVTVTGTVTADGVDVGDSEEIRLGASQDLRMYHDGTNSYVSNKTGSLYIGANDPTDVGGDVYLRAKIGENDTSIRLQDDSGIIFYSNGSLTMQMYSSFLWIYDDTTLQSSADLIFNGGNLIFDRGTYTTTLTSDNPASANQTITFPDATGTVLTTGNADVGTTTTSSGDADHVLVNDGGVLKKITPTDLGIGAGGFPSGTLMLFQQTAAPTGWTKQTTHNDKALRVVSGTAGTGGSSAFTTAFGTPSVSGSVGLSGDLAAGNLAVSMSGNISDTTLSTNQIPSHTHALTPRIQNPDANNNTRAASAPQGSSGNVNLGNSGATGGGQAHNHAHNLSGTLTGTPGTGNLAGSLSSATATINVQYVDLIIAAKD